MKLIERIKLWFKIKGEEVFVIDDLDLLKEQLNKAKEKAQEINKKYYNLQGEKKTLEMEIDSMKELNERHIKDAKVCKEHNMLDEIAILKQNIDKINEDIKLKQDKINNLNIIISNYAKARIAMGEKCNEIEHQLDTLKAKSDFAKLESEYMDSLKGMDIDCPIEELEHKIDTQYNTSLIELEESTKDEERDIKNKIKEIQKEEELQKFIDEL